PAEKAPSEPERSRTTSSKDAQTPSAATPSGPPSAAIFDVGGVLLEWNPRQLYRKLFNGEEAAMERFLAEVCTPAWNHRQDEGRTWAEATAELIARWPEQAALIEAYDARWAEMVSGPLSDTIALVEALKARGIPLYCLTNFSTEKFPLMRRRYDVFDLFDGIVVSGEIGMAKPDPAIFQHLLQRFGLAATACLFIDDVPANITTAQQLGIDTHLFRGAAALGHDLRQRGLLTE
ncbi:MAG TPA: HAD family phosphatase, partial [Rhodospirillales bacterium]|nr:HAD family phosphatase [Rhodospirillales bacterium]